MRAGRGEEGGGLFPMQADPHHVEQTTSNYPDFFLALQGRSVALSGKSLHDS